jgi:hypothetical protein
MPELKRLHRRFGHPSAQRLDRLLARAGYKDHRDQLTQLTKFCEFCQRHSRSPSRFRFQIQDEDIAFNHAIVVDVMYIDGKPVLHVVDQATRFQAARWLPDISAKTTWRAICLCWIDVYEGPPDLVIHDAGKNFTASEFQQNAKAQGIRTKCVPVEAPQSIGLIKRYHEPLHRAYVAVKEEMKSDINQQNPQWQAPEQYQHPQRRQLEPNPLRRDARDEWLAEKHMKKKGLVEGGREGYMDEQFEKGFRPRCSYSRPFRATAIFPLLVSFYFLIQCCNIAQKHKHHCSDFLFLVFFLLFNPVSQQLPSALALLQFYVVRQSLETCEMCGDDHVGTT